MFIIEQLLIIINTGYNCLDIKFNNEMRAIKIMNEFKTLSAKSPVNWPCSNVILLK